MQEFLIINVNRVLYLAFGSMAVHRFHRSDCNNQPVVRIVIIQLALLQLLRCKAIQKGAPREGVKISV
jgi:hypothetical protein